jgi:hypothetical protein
MAKSKFRALVIVASLIVAEVAHAGLAHADSILVPGAATVRVELESALARVNGDIPFAVGTPVLGSLVYAVEPLAFPLLDFSLAAGGVDFTRDDVLSSKVVEFASTLGFDAQVELKGRPGLGAFTEPFRFEIFQEFGDSNLFLSGQNANASGPVGLRFEAASPIPEPSSLVLLVTGLSLCGVKKLTRRPG